VKAEDQFHVGIVVDDLDATLARLSDLFGYDWCAVIAVATPVALPTGDAVLDLRFAYSANEPRLEVIQSIPGTLWTPVAASGIHHLGYWSDDVARDSAALEERGLLREAAGARPDGTVPWAYHRAASGPRIELVATELRPALERLWGTLSRPG
jgi:catechol 2,3-dioxygenase-like lactoylglutathione lyase family enzyme